MTADLIMLFLYLLVHFLVISMAVIIGLWLFSVTEWILNRFTDKPPASLSDTIYGDRHD